MSYLIFKKGDKKKYRMTSIDKMLDKWMFDKTNMKEEIVEDVKKSDLLYFIRCYEKQTINNYLKILNSTDFKNISREYFINKALNWYDCYENSNIYDDKILMPEEFTKCAEIEYSDLINLYNAIDWKKDILLLSKKSISSSTDIVI